MPFATTATMAGAAMGFGTQLFINALRKLPLLRSACPFLPRAILSFHRERRARAGSFILARRTRCVCGRRRAMTRAR